jgi:hypothetical protein
MSLDHLAAPLLSLSVPPRPQCKCDSMHSAAAAPGYGTHQNKQLTRAKIARGDGMPGTCASYETEGGCRRSSSSCGTATSTSAAAPLSPASLTLLLLQLATSCCDEDAAGLYRFIATRCIADRAESGQNWRCGNKGCVDTGVSRSRRASANIATKQQKLSSI